MTAGPAGVLGLLGGVASGAPVELGVFFLVGLLGGAHCLGMCGPLVTMYAERMESPSRDDVLTLYEVRQHALFNAGRTVSYAVLGGAFGLVGAVVFDASAVVAAVGTVVRGATGVAVGVLVLLVGARYLLGRHGGHSALGGGPAAAVYRRLSARVEGWAAGPGIVGLGLVHGFLPCPLLYPAFLYALARGSPVAGALSLGALGLGTFPTLFLYGTVVQSVSPAHRARLHRALGAAFLLLGWIPLAHGLELFGVHVPHPEVPVYRPPWL
ncbi:MAG: sulfite exporter TauE/SafE family protein [Halobacteriaceae archaeon]